MLDVYRMFNVCSGPWQNSVIWQNTETYKEGNVQILRLQHQVWELFDIGQAVKALYSLHYL